VARAGAPAGETPVTGGGPGRHGGCSTVGQPMLGLVLIALLASGPDRDALRRELDSVADRIEALKSRRMAGEDVEGELGRLLVRSQELAGQLERSRPQAAPPPPAQPAVDELRERADALRDEADRVARALAALDERIAEAVRSATAPPSAAAGAVLVPTSASPARSTRPAARPPAQVPIGPLVEERARLELRARDLAAAAAQLERAADALARER
jgi:hypothetical protein